jgi:uncharacterized membrane protein
VNMSSSSRLPAVLAYLPVIGWLVVLFFQRKNEFAMFHLKQSVGLFLFLVGALVVWAVIAWLLVWIPYLAVLGAALFTFVIAVYLFGFVVWIWGMINALRNQLTPLPGFGEWASRLPIR